MYELQRMKPGPIAAAPAARKSCVVLSAAKSFRSRSISPPWRPRCVGNPCSGRRPCQIGTLRPRTASGAARAPTRISSSSGPNMQRRLVCPALQGHAMRWRARADISKTVARLLLRSGASVRPSASLGARASAANAPPGLVHTRMLVPLASKACPTAPRSRSTASALSTGRWPRRCRYYMLPRAASTPPDRFPTEHALPPHGIFWCRCASPLPRPPQAPLTLPHGLQMPPPPPFRSPRSRLLHN
jgi:hypothetical protein